MIALFQSGEFDQCRQYLFKNKNALSCWSANTVQVETLQTFFFARKLLRTVPTNERYFFPGV